MFIRTQAGQLVNLSLCRIIEVENTTEGVAVVATDKTSPAVRDYKVELGVFKTLEDAVGALKFIESKLNAQGLEPEKSSKVIPPSTVSCTY